MYLLQNILYMIILKHLFLILLNYNQNMAKMELSKDVLFLLMIHNIQNISFYHIIKQIYILMNLIQNHINDDFLNFE